MKKLDERALLTACREVSRSTLWQTLKPMTIDDVIDSGQIERTVHAYFEEAKRHAAWVEEQGLDPNLVTRAVLYLAHEHAIPPMKDDVHWFRDALDVLVRLICPNSVPTREAALFMDDLKEATRRYRREAEEPLEGDESVGDV